MQRHDAANKILGSDMASLILNMAGNEQEKLTSNQCSALNIRQAGDGDSPDLLEALESGSGCCRIWCCCRRVAGDCSMADRACRHSGAGLHASNHVHWHDRLRVVQEVQHDSTSCALRYWGGQPQGAEQAFVHCHRQAASYLVTQESGTVIISCRMLGNC